jgi:hypothetical protein
VRAAAESTVVELQGWPGVPDDGAHDRFVLEGFGAAVLGPEFNGYGFAFHALDAAHYSVFALGSDGYYAVLRIDGEVEIPLVTWQQFPHIRRGQEENRFRLECEESRCEFYINDEYVTTVEDAAWSGGDVGLWVRAFEDEPVEAEFRSLGVWTREASTGLGRLRTPAGGVYFLRS